MKRTGLLLLSAVTFFGCQRDDAVSRKAAEATADYQKKSLENQQKMISALAAGGGAGAAKRPQRPQRPRPAPDAVYSVNIKGAPFVGTKDAKVTIVEAFEFA